MANGIWDHNDVMGGHTARMGHLLHRRMLQRRRRTRAFGLTLTMLCGLLLALNAGASAETGQSGKTGEPVYDEIAGTFVAEGWSGIEVCAISVENQNARWCATTKRIGEYSITNVPPGEYVVYFPAPGGELKGQYYRQAWTRAEAQPIVVRCCSSRRRCYARSPATGRS